MAPPADNTTAEPPRTVRRSARKTRAPPSPLKYSHLMNNNKCAQYKAKKDVNNPAFKKRTAKATYDKR
jgi:hypothetical protein